MVEVVHDSYRKIAYQFLDELRESGAVNMFGAAQDLREEFGFDKPTSRALLSDWMEQYESNSWKKEDVSPVVDEDELPERKY